MKNYLKIENEGLLDIRLIGLMGGTTKTGQSKKIGQFGTGLKYVLAYMIRNEIDFLVNIDGKSVEIGCEEETISETLFKIITIDGHKTSITDKMGLEWKPWMIVRELYSNALDEGGASYGVVSEQELNNQDHTGKTVFAIEMTPDFMRVFNDWKDYFIVGRIPMYENEQFALHPTSGNLKIYKNGILIHEEEGTKAVFNYDIKNASINEMREYKGNLSSDFSDIIFKISDEKTIEYFLENINKSSENDGELFEACVDLTYWRDYDKMNKAWETVIGNAKVIHPEAKKNIISKMVNIDLSHTIEVPKNIYKALTQSFKGIGALRVADKTNEFYEIIDDELVLKNSQAIVILEDIGYFIHPELKFVYGEFGNKSTLARVNTDAKEIMISHKMKDSSLFEFCAMLIEENEHFQTGMNDCTRSFQQHFINLYTRALLDKAGVKI